MPTGFSGVREAAKDIESRRQAGASSAPQGVNWFRISDGESATVRFLEQGDEFTWAWVHEMPPRGKQRWGDDSPCLDQAGDGTSCPGCEAGLDKKFKAFIGLIWRDGPVYARTPEGRIAKGGDGKYIVDSRKDQVFVWERGITHAQELDGKDATYKGLKSRDFVITRKGATMNDTTYNIEPAVDAEGNTAAVPMSDADKELEKEKPDLKGFTVPVAYDTMKGWLGHQSQPGNGAAQQQPSGTPVGGDVNPFIET